MVLISREVLKALEPESFKFYALYFTINTRRRNIKNGYYTTYVLPLQKSNKIAFYIFFAIDISVFLKIFMVNRDMHILFDFNRVFFKRYSFNLNIQINLKRTGL